MGVDEIGERAGVTGPAIYRHFSGKDELLATLFDEAMDRLLVRAGGEEREPLVELEHLIRAQTEFALHDRELLSVYAREDRSLAEPYRRRIHRRERQHVEHWVDVLERCYPNRTRDELTSAAYAAIGLLLSVAHWPRSALVTEDLPELLRELVMGGLAALDSRRNGRPAGGSSRAKPRASRTLAGRATARRRS